MRTGIALIAALLLGSGAPEPAGTPAESSPDDRSGTILHAGTGDTLVIGAVGDIMLGNWVVDVLREHGPAYPYGEILPILQSTDLLIGNLEAPFMSDTTGIRRADKTYTFAVPHEVVSTVIAGGFNVVGLANNHILDYGYTGLYETWAVLDSAGIHHAGTGRNRKEAHAHSIVESKGLKIAFLAYNHTFPEEFWATADRPGTAHASDEGLVREVRDADKEADIVIVSFHWGSEQMEWPKEYQRILGHIAIDSGADLVIGHHPHTVQTLEWYKDRLIAYSLGNFIFGSYTDSANGALILTRFVEETPVEVDLYPLDVNNLRREFRPRPTPPSMWPLLQSTVVTALADSAAAGYSGVRIDPRGFLRLTPP